MITTQTSKNEFHLQLQLSSTDYSILKQNLSIQFNSITAKAKTNVTLFLIHPFWTMEYSTISRACVVFLVSISYIIIVVFSFIVLIMYFKQNVHVIRR